MEINLTCLVLVAACSFFVSGLGPILETNGSSSADQLKSEPVTSPPIIPDGALPTASDRSQDEVLTTDADHQTATGGPTRPQSDAGEDCTDDISGDEGEVQSPEYKVMVTCQNWTRVVSVSAGYNITLEVESLDLDKVNQDYLTVNPGGLETLDETTPIFTGRLTSARSLLIINTNSVFIRFWAQQARREDSGETPSGFKITFKREGEITTTPLPTTPVITLPTAAPGMHQIQVYLKGLKREQFQNALPDFLKIVADTANTYCEINQIYQENPATKRNVRIWYLTQCPKTWLDSEVCVHIIMSVVIDTGSEGNYELTQEKLSKMWLLVAEDPQLRQMELQVFFPPDSSEVLLPWVYASIGVLAFFILFLLLVWRLDLIKQYNPLSYTNESSYPPEKVIDTPDIFPEDLDGPITEFEPNKFDTGPVAWSAPSNMDKPLSNKSPTTTDSLTNMGPPPSYGLPKGIGFWPQSSLFLQTVESTPEDNPSAHINQGYDFESDLPTQRIKDWKDTEETLL